MYSVSDTGAGSDRQNGAMGMSFEPDLHYSSNSSGRDMTPCKAERVKDPVNFALAGDRNNIGINTRRPDDVRRVGFHGCTYTQCQNSAHGDVPPGQEQSPRQAATNQWIFADGHAKKMTYKEVIATEGRIFNRNGGYSWVDPDPNG